VSEAALKALVGTALLDREFGEELLRGGGGALLAGFDLTSEEQEAILSIQADSVPELAARLREWLRR
jgi:hypothetical protein